MRINLTFEPRIIRYLQLNGNSDIDELVNFFTDSRIVMPRIRQIEISVVSDSDCQRRVKR
jgi:hypothetical protein